MRTVLPRHDTTRLIVYRFLLLTPLVLAAAVMIPRILNAQFGLLDDGRTIAMARQVSHGDWLPIWEVGSGRTRPVYWLFNTVVYMLVGASPTAFYVVNGLIFVGLAASLIWLARGIGLSRLQAWLTGMFFVFSGATIESFYTLSKPEAPQTSLIVASVVILLLLYRARSRGWRLVAFALLCIVLLLADLTKEISPVVVAIGIASLVGSLWAWRGPQSRRKRLTLGIYCVAGVIGAALFFALRYIFSNPGAAVGTYSTNYVLSLSRLAASVVRWSGWLIRDYAYVVPLVLLWACFSISRRRILDRDLLIGSLVWMGAWFGVYLPWRAAHEFYLLAFACGGAFLGGVIVAQAIREFVERGTVWRWWIGLCLALAGVLFLTLQLNDLTNARLQLAVDSANGETLGRIAEGLPPDAVLLVNIQAPSEYVDEIKLQMPEIYNRADIAVDYFVPGQSYAQSSAGARYFVMTPVVQNFPLLKTRGPGAGEANATQWGESMKTSLGGSLEPVFEVVRSVRLSAVDLPRLFCPLMRHKGYCITQSPILDLRILRYGWQVYEIKQ